MHSWWDALQPMQADKGHLFFAGDGRRCPWHQTEADLSPLVKVAAHNGTEQDRQSLNRAKLCDVEPQKAPIARVRIGFSLRALAGLVVVTKLDQCKTRPGL